MQLQIVSLFHLLLVTWCTAWPLRWCVQNLQLSLQLYSLGNSNLDIFFVTLLYYIFQITALLVSWLLVSRSQFPNARKKIVQIIIHVCSSIIIILLITKSTCVAILSDDTGRGGGIWFPPSTCTKHSGLFWVFIPIVAGLILIPYFNCLCQGAITNIMKSSQTRDVETPLLQQSEDQDERNKQESRKILSRTLRKALCKQLPFFVPAYAMGALAAVFQAAIDYFTGRVLDATIEMVYQRLVYYISLLAIVGLSYAITSAFRGSLMVAGSGGLTRTFRVDLFASLIQQEAAYFDVTRTGDIMSRFSSDIQELTDMFTLNLNILWRCLMQIITVLAFMFATSWRLTIITFILLPIIIVLCRVYGQYYRKFVKQAQNKAADATAVAEETFSGIATVRAHAAEDSVSAHFAQHINQYVGLIYKEAFAYFLWLLLNNGLPVLLLVVVLLYGGHLVFIEKDSKAGWLVSFILYEKSLMSAFTNVGDVYSGLITAVGASEKVVEMTNRKTKINLLEGRYIPPLFFGRVQLKNVTFSYPSRPEIKILKNLNLDVQAGEVVAIVGPSGSGKSSIIKLLQRLYQPEQGRVLLDGVDIGEYEYKWLRRKVALVSQEPVLFNRSILDNIKLGLTKDDGVEEVAFEQVRFAAVQSNAEKFIETFPQGYDTICGEKGTHMSGGQKQRVAIARALVRQPKILLLDEATSALDGESEALVQEALENVMVGHTVIVVAHRLSTVVNADRIVVLYEGKIAESGTHQELYEKDGIYTNLIRKQLSGNVIVSSPL